MEISSTWSAEKHVKVVELVIKVESQLAFHGRYRCRTNQDCETIGHCQCNAGNLCEVSTDINKEAGADSGHLWDYSTAHIAHVSEGSSIQSVSCAETRCSPMTQMPVSRFASKYWS